MAECAQEAQLKAERDAARRARELAELRTGLEVQLGEARREASAARDQMALLKRDLDMAPLAAEESVLGALEAELRRPAGAGRAGPSPDVQQVCLCVQQVCMYVCACVCGGGEDVSW